MKKLVTYSGLAVKCLLLFASVYVLAFTAVFAGIGYVLSAPFRLQGYLGRKLLNSIDQSFVNLQPVQKDFSNVLDLTRYRQLKKAA